MIKPIIIQLGLFILCNSYQAQEDTTTYPAYKLINQKVPVLNKKSIDGIVIDSNYFKNKITILTFFGFGCGPCYSELRLLDEIRKKYPREKYQILLIGDSSENDLMDLRSKQSKKNRKIKRKLGLDSLAFDMVADCPDHPVKPFSKSCKGSTDTFYVTALPSTFFINENAVIKSFCHGFSMGRDKIWDDYFYSKLQEAEK